MALRPPGTTPRKSMAHLFGISGIISQAWHLKRGWWIKRCWFTISGDVGGEKHQHCIQMIGTTTWKTTIACWKITI